MGNITRLYDAAGNTTKIGGNARQFVYDNSGRMTQVKSGGAATRQYEYNAKGEQVRAYLDPDSAYFAYDEAGHLLGEYGSDGSPKQQVLWFGDLPVGVLQGAGAGQQLHYIEPDHLGSPRAIIDGSRNVAIWEWKLTGEVFGATPPNQDPDGDGVHFTFDLRFPGQRYDQATGLNYNYFRDYDPGTGRYVESDPIGLRGGVSTYGYVFQQPTKYTDELGLFAILAGGAATGANEDYGRTSCDGNGGFQIEIFNKTCTGECTRAHEEEHARNLKRSGHGDCRNKPKGAGVWPDDLPYDQWVLYNAETECKAHAATLSCLEKLKARLGSSCDDACRQQMERHANSARGWRRYYRCAAYRW